MAQQVGDPLAVPHVGLAAGHRLDVPRIDQQQRELSSSRFQSGFQYTPVLSIATWVQPAASSQSASASRSAVIVPKVRISFAG